MVNFLVTKLTQCLLNRDTAIFIIFNGVNDVVISNTPLDHIIKFLHFSGVTTINDVIEPFKIVFKKHLDAIAISCNLVIIQCKDTDCRLKVRSLTNSNGT